MNLRFTAAYGLGHFGKSLFWSCGESLFVFYLTEICGLSPGRAGLVVGSALLFSAIADLILLRLCHRLLARPGGVPRLQAVGAVLAAMFFLLFSLTAWLPPDYRLSGALFSSLAFRAAYSILDVPQNALLGLVPETIEQRTRLASIRMVGSGLAGLSVSGFAYYMISGIGALTTGLAAAGIGCIAVTGALLTMKTAPQPRRPRSDGPPILWRRLISVRVTWVLAVGALGAMASTCLSKLMPYFAAYGLNSPSAGGLLMAAVTSGWVLSQPFWLMLGDRRTRRNAIELQCLALLLASLLFYPASFMGLWATLPCALAQGAGIGGLGLSVWAALADEAGSRAGNSAGVAFLFALLTFLNKSALAAAAVAVALTLSAHPYRSSQGEWPLLSVMCLCPVLLSSLCLGLTRLLKGGEPACRRAID